MDLVPYLRRDNPILLEKSLLNCHVTGVHSLVLDQDESGYLTRMFIADKDHLLWHNGCGQTYKGWMPLSVAIHPHHTDIEIFPVFGYLWNVEFSRKKHKAYKQGQLSINRYSWRSEILGEGGKFRKSGSEILVLDKFRTLHCGFSYKMKSGALHTVYVTKGQVAAWVIKESEPADDYDHYNYSNADLTKWKPDGLYQKPTLDDIEELLKMIHLKFQE